MNATVLVTGGAGYIGTHVALALAAAGRKSLWIDNYSNSSPISLERVNALAPGAVESVEMDISDGPAIQRLLTGRSIDSVIHLAGLKAVAESVERPAHYHHNNVVGTQRLLEALQATGTRNFIFSSSACVYAITRKQPVDETASTGPNSPYGENKLEIEQMLARTAREDSSWRVTNLRYFNPIGAHESGAIGEDPNGVPNNLMPYVCQVASGRLPRLNVWGNDYATADGTGVRDYIHVMDLAEGHVAALTALERSSPGSVATLNLGTGHGTSVLQLVEAFEKTNGVRIPLEFAARRAGDIAICYADPSLANRTLGWKAKRTLGEMCRDAWNWQRKNPNGYGV